MARRTHRRLLAIGLACCAFVLACAPTPAAAPAQPRASTGGGPALAAPAPPAPARLTNVKLGLTAISPAAWPAYAGLERGFFEQEGIDLEPLVLTSSVTQTQALLAGDIQVNAAGVDSTAKAVAGGAPLKVVGSAQETPSFQLIVGNDVRGWADLRGKVVASGSPGGYFDVVLRAMLAANGLNHGDYEIRNLPNSGPRLAAVQAGQAAAAMMNDPETFVAIAGGLRSFGYVTDYVKDVTYNVYAVDAQWASANEAVLVSFLRGARKSVAWLLDSANKEPAKALYGRIANAEPRYLEDTYDQMVRQGMLAPTLRPNLKGVENVLALSHQIGSLSEIPPFDTWIDLSYLEKADR